MERRFLLLVSLLLLATGTATGEQPPRRTAVADHPAIVGRRLGTTTAAPCDPLCIYGAAAGATPEAMAAAAMVGNESALPPRPRQLDRRPDGGLPSTHQSWIYYGPVHTTPYSTAPAASSLLRATAVAVVFSTMLLVAAAASYLSSSIDIPWGLDLLQPFVLCASFS